MKKLLLFIAIFVTSIVYGFAQNTTVTIRDNNTYNAASGTGKCTGTAAITCKFIAAMQICVSPSSLDLGELAVSGTAYSIGQTIAFTITGENSHKIYYSTSATANGSNKTIDYDGYFYTGTCTSTHITNGNLTLGAATSNSVTTSSTNINYYLNTVKSSTPGAGELDLSVTISYNTL